MSKGHSSIGASSASRWFECPGSVALSEHAPVQPSNVHAAQGTAAHKVLEECFQTDKDPWDFEEMEFPGGELNEEDIEAVVEALDWLDAKVEEIREKYKTVTAFKEVEFDLTIIHDNLWGTGDIVLFTKDFSYIGVFDYKHGKGVTVEVAGNKQLKYYLLGAIEFIGHKLLKTLGWGNVFHDMEIGILQPRVEHIDGSMRVAHIGSQEVEDFAVELAERAAATAQPDAQLKAGSHCRWCRAKPLCPQLYNNQLEVAQTDFAAVKPKPPAIGTLTNDQIANVMANADLMTDWLKSIKALAQQKLERGEKVAGYKLVKKKANRVWRVSEAVVTNTFNNWEIQTHETKLMSPAKIEKQLKDFPDMKAEIQGMIESPNNGNTIASETDRRQEVPSSVLTDFKPITKGN